MSDVVSFSFVASEQDIAAWENVFSLLDAGHQGARFQDAMDAFGEAVTDKLETILDNEDFDGPESFVFEGRSREGEQFSFEMDLPYELVSEFEALFRLCTVTGLTVEVPE